MPDTISINFRGGIIPPDKLYNIMNAMQRLKVLYVRFSLRQQLLIDMEHFTIPLFSQEMEKLGIPFEVGSLAHPNIISSYPAEDVFIRNTWLSEAIYQEVFDSFIYEPTIKINICDSNQSITPMITGNINWIANPSAPHYWHLIIRFPKTNVVYEWNQLCNTNEISKISRALENIMLERPAEFIDNQSADGDKLFSLLDTTGIIVKAAQEKAVLPQFNLPYYEGLNRYGNKYWLGIYRRDELFSVAFLKKVSRLCMDTGINKLCCTAWKTIMIKGIDEKDKEGWNLVLEEFHINMRHAANELNFQVEDNSEEGLELKNFLVKHLSKDDIRTFGICIGIKTRKKSEVFSSILVRRRFLIDFLGIRLFKVYDIMCAKDFNPNERTEEIYSSSNPRIVLPEQLRRSVWKYYDYRAHITGKKVTPEDRLKKLLAQEEYVYQCSNCLNIYDPAKGETSSGIPPGTLFQNLTDLYTCAECDAGKDAFVQIKKGVAGVQKPQ